MEEEIETVKRDKKIMVLHIAKDMIGGIGTVIAALKDSGKSRSYRGHSIVLKGATGSNDSLLRSFIKLKKRFDLCVKRAEIIHLHGAWHLHVLLLCNRLANTRPVVVSPHGALDQVSLKKSRFKKMIVKYLYMKWCYMHARCMHALTEKEAKDIIDYGIKGRPIAVIPNGIDMKEKIEIDEAIVDELIKLANGKKVFLSLSRLHPAKGLENLIEAFYRLHQKNEDTVLFIVGEGSNRYKEKLKKKINKLHLGTKVFLLGEMQGIARNTVYDIADIFVLPSFNEGFGLTVLEAFRQKIPVITTDATPFTFIEEEQCGWYIAPTEDDVFTALEKAANATDEALREMGERGYWWIKENYSLEDIQNRYEALYLWLVGGGERPSFVLESDDENLKHEGNALG